jgi:hypothetical protein
MAPRETVAAFVELGPLPDSAAPEEQIALHEELLKKIEAPVTDEEAALLLSCFGPDDCYGLAWTLLHLIESAPGGVRLLSEPPSSANEWIRRLWARANRDDMPAGAMLPVLARNFKGN